MRSAVISWGRKNGILVGKGYFFLQILHNVVEVRG